MSYSRSHHRATRVVIDRQAYQHNLARVREFTPDSKVMAVIKANGYGHGMEWSAEALADVDEYAVTCMDDAWRLREQGITKPLTLLSSRYTAQDYGQLSQQSIRPVIYDFEQLKTLLEQPSAAALDVWLKVDTGMGRLGFAEQELPFVLAKMEQAPGIRSISLMSHLANADNPDQPENKRQIQRFDQCLSQYTFTQSSLLNSAGVTAFSEHAHEVVRPGLMLYGISPLRDQSSAALDLRPVMSFKSELISVKSMPAGANIGYGSTYVLDHDSRIGVVACGYGDGYPRHAPSGTPVLVNNVLVPLIGRVSMDLLTVDLGEIDVAVGDEVVLWGAENPIEEVARMAGTIGYELTCGITERVERILKE